MIVNGHELPALLSTMIENGTWPPPATLLANIAFQDDRVRFLDVPQMHKEAGSLAHICDRGLGHLYALQYQSERPEILDPRATVPIATGPNENGLCLDYRTSGPRVVAFKSSPPRVAWVEIAASFPQLVRQLGIGDKADASYQSLAISELAWGRVVVAPGTEFRDVKLWPGGAREWNWRETGTRHVPGIQPGDVQELLDQGADVIVLSRGQQLVLETQPETLALLAARGIEVHQLESRAAVQKYNELVAAGRRVGALIHSTC